MPLINSSQIADSDNRVNRALLPITTPSLELAPRVLTASLFAVTMIDMPPLDDRVLVALEQNPYLTRRNLRFETSDGRVTLRGIVGTYFQKQMAQEAIRHIAGVEEIANELEVCGDTIPLSLRERAGVRGKWEGLSISEAGVFGDSPHPNPLPEGEGTLASTWAAADRPHP